MTLMIHTNFNLQSIFDKNSFENKSSPMPLAKIQMIITNKI